MIAWDKPHDHHIDSQCGLYRISRDKTPADCQRYGGTARYTLWIKAQTAPAQAIASSGTGPWHAVVNNLPDIATAQRAANAHAGADPGPTHAAAGNGAVTEARESPAA